MKNEELYKIAPKLSKIEKKNSYQVPDGYFDTFPQRLQERLHPEKEVSFAEKLIILIKPHVTLATMMVGVFIIAFFAIHLFTSENINNIETVNTGMADMLEYELNEMDEISLMEMLAADEEVEVTTYEEDAYIEEAIEYLMNEGVSIETLMQELEI